MSKYSIVKCPCCGKFVLKIERGSNGNESKGERRS